MATIAVRASERERPSAECGEHFDGVEPTYRAAWDRLWQSTAVEAAPAKRRLEAIATFQLLRLTEQFDRINQDDGAEGPERLVRAGTGRQIAEALRRSPNTSEAILGVLSDVGWIERGIGTIALVGLDELGRVFQQRRSESDLRGYLYTHRLTWTWRVARRLWLSKNSSWLAALGFYEMLRLDGARSVWETGLVEKVSRAGWARELGVDRATMRAWLELLTHECVNLVNVGANGDELELVDFHSIEGRRDAPVLRPDDDAPVENGSRDLLRFARKSTRVRAKIHHPRAQKFTSPTTADLGRRDKTVLKTQDTQVKLLLPSRTQTVGPDNGRDDSNPATPEPHRPSQHQNKSRTDGTEGAEAYPNESDRGGGVAPGCVSESVRDPAESWVDEAEEWVAECRAEIAERVASEFGDHDRVRLKLAASSALRAALWSRALHYDAGVVAQIVSARSVSDLQIRSDVINVVAARIRTLEPHVIYAEEARRHDATEVLRAAEEQVADGRDQADFAARSWRVRCLLGAVFGSDELGRIIEYFENEGGDGHVAIRRSLCAGAVEQWALAVVANSCGAGGGGVVTALRDALDQELYLGLSLKSLGQITSGASTIEVPEIVVPGREDEDLAATFEAAIEAGLKPTAEG